VDGLGCEGKVDWRYLEWALSPGATLGSTAAEAKIRCYEVGGAAEDGGKGALCATRSGGGGHSEVEVGVGVVGGALAFTHPHNVGDCAAVQPLYAILRIKHLVVVDFVCELRVHKEVGASQISAIFF
jgi:hypothetical protein